MDKILHHQGWWLIIMIIPLFRGFPTIPGGAGFLPSTVSTPLYRHISVNGKADHSQNPEAKVPPCIVWFESARELSLWKLEEKGRFRFFKIFGTFLAHLLHFIESYWIILNQHALFSKRTPGCQRLHRILRWLVCLRGKSTPEKSLLPVLWWILILHNWEIEWLSSDPIFGKMKYCPLCLGAKFTMSLLILTYMVGDA